MYIFSLKNDDRFLNIIENVLKLRLFILSYLKILKEFSACCLVKIDKNK
jgi:hypothetical protein